MIAELVVLSLLFLAAETLLLWLGVRSSALRLALSLPFALALGVALGIVVVATRVPVPTYLVLAAPILAAAVVLRRHGRPAGAAWWPIPVGLAGTLVVGRTAWEQGLLRMTPDSYEYAYSSGLFHKVDSVDLHLAQILEARSFALVYVNSMAGDLHGNLYLPSLVPLLATAALLLVGTLTYLLSRSGQHPPLPSLALAAGAVLFVGSTSRFLYNASYINSHMWAAVLVLGFAGLAILRLVDGDAIDDRALAVAGALFLGALVVSRPEGLLLAGTLVLPALASRPLPHVVGRAWLAGLGGTGVLWYGVILALKFLGQDLPVPLSVTGSLGLSVLLVLLACAPSQVFDVPRPWHAWAAFAASSVVFVGGVVIRPSTFRTSALATYENVVVGAGLWGRSLVVLSVALVVATVLGRARHRHVLLLPLVWAVPLSISLAYLRESPYRVGSGDSLNRMLLHWFPLAVLAVVHAVVGQRETSEEELVDVADPVAPTASDETAVSRR